MTRQIGIRIYRGSELFDTRFLEREIIKIGRLASADVCIEDLKVSRIHAVIEVDDEAVAIIDMGSTDGTRVNGSKVKRVLLKHGDEIGVGDARLVVVLDELELARELASLGESATHEASNRLGQLAYTLSPVPSQATAFSLDGAHAIHFLRTREGLLAGNDYCARIDLAGVLPAFSICGGGAFDDATFGPRVPVPLPAMSLLTARTRAPDVLRAFCTEAIAAGFPTTATRIALVRHSAELSVLEVDIDVGRGQIVDYAAEKAAQLGAVAVALVRANATFAERAVDTRPAVEQLQSVLELLSSSTAWLSGPVARVGEGVEARLVLEELDDHPSALRVDVDATGSTSFSLRAPLKVTPSKTTTLTPQAGIGGALRGLLDKKSGDKAFDDRWIIDGDVEVARGLQRAEGELAALHRVGARIEHGVDGLVIRAAGFAFEADDVVDAIDASLQLWRRLIVAGHGLAAT